jgi:hypothetical protein
MERTSNLLFGLIKVLNLERFRIAESGTETLSRLTVHITMSDF